MSQTCPFASAQGAHPSPSNTWTFVTPSSFAVESIPLFCAKASSDRAISSDRASPNIPLSSRWSANSSIDQPLSTPSAISFSTRSRVVWSISVISSPPRSVAYFRAFLSK